jgi:hypothetical protein
MRYLLAIALFVLVASALCQQQHCIGEAFTSKSVLVDPSKDVDDENTIWFDATTNKQRLDVIVYEPVFSHLQVFYRHDLRKVRPN